MKSSVFCATQHSKWTESKQKTDETLKVISLFPKATISTWYFRVQQPATEANDAANRAATATETNARPTNDCLRGRPG
jgi:hypothetical protein